MICDICNKPLEGIYMLDRWGTKTHPQHNGRETSKCYCCGRYVDDTDRNKALLYGDGRVICRSCHDNAVNSVEIGRKAKMEVFSLFQKARLILPENRIKLVINDRKYAKQTLGKDSFHGLMRTTCTASLFKACKDYRVFIISGLHIEIFKGVLAHELMHVYISENGIVLNHVEEEGLCELVNYYMLQASKTKIGDIQMQIIIENTDAVYGDGFRLMKSRIEQAGSWKKLMDNLK